MGDLKFRQVQDMKVICSLCFFALLSVFQAHAQSVSDAALRQCSASIAAHNSEYGDLETATQGRLSKARQEQEQKLKKKFSSMVQPQSEAISSFVADYESISKESTLSEDTRRGLIDKLRQTLTSLVPALGDRAL